MTQLESARNGVLTPEVQAVARAEGRRPEEIRDLVAAGRTVVPANPAHESLRRFAGIGGGLSVKINTNLGTSYDYVNLDEELEKTRVALRYGTDALMDLSTGGDLPGIRRAILDACDVPLGTVPVYEAEFRAADRSSFYEMTNDDLFDVIAEHGRQGVDYITVHAAVTRATLDRYRRGGRTAGMVSRGGALMAAWMVHHDRENPLYDQYDRLLEIAREHDMTLSLGDGLRPGCVDDATDRPQIQELIVIGELIDRARRAGVQAMVEGPGHVPLNEIESNVRVQKRLTDNAPFYILGMLPTDLAAGYDHVAGAIGGALAGWHGADMLCYLTPAEHLGLPTVEHVREGVAVFKLAAHIADVARGDRRSLDRCREMGRARAELDWDRQLELALFADDARAIHADRGSKTPACSMCGPFCPIRLARERLGAGPREPGDADGIDRSDAVPESAAP